MAGDETTGRASHTGQERNVMQLIVLVALAGAIGSLARWQVSGLVNARVGPGIHWGTLVVNLMGAFLFGLVYAAATHRGLLGDTARVVLLSGFLGAFTTFSALAFESAEMVTAGRVTLAAVNYIGQGVLGVLAMFAGMALGRG